MMSPYGGVAAGYIRYTANLQKWRTIGCLYLGMLSSLTRLWLTILQYVDPRDVRYGR